MGRGLIIGLLVVSAALNIFFVGVHSGRLLHGALPQKPAHEKIRIAEPDNPFRVLRHAEELSPESREKFRLAVKSALPSARENYQETKRLRKELSDLLLADEWDRETVAAKMEEIQALQVSQRAAFDKAFLDALETLTADERRQLMKAAEDHRLERRERFKKRMDERRGPPPEAPEAE